MIINIQMADNFFDGLPIELLGEIFIYVLYEEEYFELLRQVNNNFKTVIDGIENKLGRTIIFTQTKVNDYILSEPLVVKWGAISSGFFTGNTRYEYSCYKKIETIPASYATEFINVNGTIIKNYNNNINLYDQCNEENFSYYDEGEHAQGWYTTFLPDLLATSYLLSKHRYFEDPVFICKSLNKTLHYYINCIKCDRNVEPKNIDDVLLWYQSELWPQNGRQINDTV
jgi:hypothetical protein